MAPQGDRLGIWGKPTSTLDWCEENYLVTPYIAEFWNTVSNVVMIIPPFVCALYYWKKGIEFRYLLANFSLLIVGIGSWMFHMTLWYEMQVTVRSFVDVSFSRNYLSFFRKLTQQKCQALKRNSVSGH